ncbi:calcium-binding protein [Pseudoxanthomonas broegbernensis]|uniref:Calcium-binding protein n=1 Tax=Pseudoxanthomonas broegbernensis TaxID=83619 RepID=A0A7V8GLK4_9GAMM|nr:DUF937 domain-containing protein [Pseudoxanthomonas broegbernensis]KAF1685899.1 calcium-binding protein [Pseudoxanthomonas broegbernensis]MBB6064124.1 hypothetical protein [Pseudoxanthomonas broegbernensis]
MSNTLTDQLFAQLSGAPLQQISQQLGLDQAQTTGAVGAALPLLLGVLGRNAGQPQGAEALFGALQKDFSGAGDLGGLLGAVLGGAQSRQTNGAGILGHVLGSQQPRAEAALGQATGLGGDKAGQLLKILAPIVLAFLAKQVFQGPAGNARSAPSAGLLGSILGQEQQQVRQQGGLGGGLLGAVLDQDGDGQLGLGDLLKIGGGLLGGKR